MSVVTQYQYQFQCVPNASKPRDALTEPCHASVAWGIVPKKSAQSNVRLCSTEAASVKTALTAHVYASSVAWSACLGMSANMGWPLAASKLLVLVFWKSVCGLDLRCVRGV